MKRIGFSMLALGALSACGGATGPSDKPLQTASLTASYTMLKDVTQRQVFATRSASQKYTLNTGQTGGQSELYTADQPVTTDAVQITFDPRDLTYELTVKSASIDQNVRYQDPMHRTAIPQAETPMLANVRYLEAGTAGDIKTLFFETPGTRTDYVTWAGFLRRTNDALAQGNPANFQPRKEEWERSAFVYGMTTSAGDLPRTGTGTFNGGLFAWFVDHAIGTGRPLYSISGTSTSTVDFAAGTIGTALAGTVLETGSSFAASGSSRVNAGTSSFTGSFTSMTVAGASRTIGASTIEGGFYGPAGRELGAAFRIVGPSPDTRMDVLGAFTGKQQ